MHRRSLRTGASFQLEALSLAADKVRALQKEDGSLNIESGGLAGSPVTYGTTLATVMGRDVLTHAGGHENKRAADRAKQWLQRRRPPGVLDAAALLLDLPKDPAARDHSLKIIRKGQTREGGWGPYANSAPEPFDTAVVLLALAALEERSGLGEVIRRGRSYLTRTQMTEGSWIETTRPPGEVSYAHRISTTGWATLALLKTRNLIER